MTTPAIPAGFTPKVASYAYSGPEGGVRTETSGGPHRHSRFWAGGVQRFSCQLVLPKDLFSVWNAWFFKIIKKGALAFTMRLDSGMGTTSHTVTMVPGSYAVGTNSGTFTVAFEVQTPASVYSLSSPDLAAFVSANSLTATALPTGFVPIAAQYSISGVGGVLGNDGGAVGQAALQQMGGVQQYSVTLILTAAQMQVFTVWYHRVNACGAITFDMVLDSGFGAELHGANINPGTLSVARSGGILSVVSFVVDAESKAQQMSTADAQALLDLYGLYGNGSDELLAAIAQFALVDSLVLDW